MHLFWMHNNANREGVSTQKQLSKDRVMPLITPHFQMSLRERSRKFNPFLSLIIMRNVRSLEEKMDKQGALIRAHRNIGKVKYHLFSADMTAGTTRKPFKPYFRPHGQTKTADRDITVKEGGNQCLSTTDGILLEITLRRSIFAPQMLNCWL